MKLSRIVIVTLLIRISYPVSSTKVYANLLDRFKDIYDAPERLEQIQQQYEASVTLLESELKAQKEQFEESSRQLQEMLVKQEELQISNENFRQQNEELMSEREELWTERAELLSEKEAMIAELENAEAKRQDLFQKGAYSFGALLAVIIAYAASVRIWRFMVWRRQGREGQGAMLP